MLAKRAVLWLALLAVTIFAVWGASPRLEAQSELDEVLPARLEMLVYPPTEENSAELAAIAQPDTATVATPLLPRLTKLGYLPVDSSSHVVMDVAQEKLYASMYSWDRLQFELHEYQAGSLNLLRTLPLPKSVDHILWLGATLDGQRLYYVTNNNQIGVINLATWTHHPTMTVLPYLSNYMAIGADNLLYIQFSNGGGVVGLDVYTGAITKAIGLAEITISHTVWHNDLYILTAGNNHTTLHKYDVSGAEAVFVASRTLTDLSLGYLSINQVINNGDILLVWSSNNGVLAFDSATLEDSPLLNHLPNDFSLWHISADAQYAFRPYTDWGQGGYTHFIQQYDVATGELAAFLPWSENSYPTIMALLPNHDIILSNLYVYRRLIHNVAIPMMGNKNCAHNPLIDDFANSYTNWPVFNTPYTEVGYFDGRYLIHHLRNSQWLAVTNRNGTDDHTILTVEVERVGSSVSGLIFGIKPNWEEFFTLEYYPEYQTAAIFRFHHSSGWELLQYSNQYAFSNQIRLTIVLSPDIGDNYPRDLYALVIDLTNSNVTSLSSSGHDLRGYLGLIGGSTNGAGISWFDNYTLERKSCGFTDWATNDNQDHGVNSINSWVQEPLPTWFTERPPLTSFLP